jgi:hypothetical protein
MFTRESDGDERQGREMGRTWSDTSFSAHSPLFQGEKKKSRNNNK